MGGLIVAGIGVMVGSDACVGVRVGANGRLSVRGGVIVKVGGGMGV